MVVKIIYYEITKQLALHNFFASPCQAIFTYSGSTNFLGEFQSDSSRINYIIVDMDSSSSESVDDEETDYQGSIQPYMFEPAVAFDSASARVEGSAKLNVNAGLLAKVVSEWRVVQRCNFTIQVI